MTSLIAIKPFFRCVLPLPPSVNEAYKDVVVGSHVRRVATEELNTFKQLVYCEMHQQATVDWAQVEAIKVSRLKVPLELSLNFYLIELWRSDVDNRVKVAQDVIFSFLNQQVSGPAKLNDNSVKRLFAEKHLDKERPRVEVELRCVVR